MGGEHPDWLPADWKVSVKIRSFGRKDKYYIHPSSGLTLSSKLEVLRYLESSGKKSNPKEMNETVAEKLPPGWIKEVRTTKKKGKTRRDLYYIDPVSGLQFRSMPEVFRYLKSKDSGEVESKLDNKGHTSMELVHHSESSSAEAEGQRSIVKKGNKSTTEPEIVKSGPTAATLKNIEKPLVEGSYKEDDSVAQKLQNKLPQANGEERWNGGRRQSKRLSGIKLKDDTKDHPLQSAGLESPAEVKMKILEKNGSEQREKENSCKEESQQHKTPARQKKRKAANGKGMSNLPLRTSKRLARLEVDQSVKVKTSDQSGASAIVCEGEVDSTKNAGTCGESVEPEIDTSIKFDGTDPGEKCRMENPTNEEQKVAITPENVSPEGQKSIEAVQHEDQKQCRMENPINDEQKKAITAENISPEEHKSNGAVQHEDQKHEIHLDSSLKDMFMDPCIEFAIRTLTGAIPFEEVIKKAYEKPVPSKQRPGCSSVSPCGDIWSDPCFEFAVKTLKGEMPPPSSSGGSGDPPLARG